MLKTSKLLGLLALALLLLPAGASAFTTKAGEIISLDKDQVVDGSYYAAGNSIVIDGKVTGDLVCAAQSVTVNGEVGGDVICTGQSVNINGKVGGNLRSAASSIILNGTVGKNATLASANLSTNASSTIGGDLLMALASADLRGKIGKDLAGIGSIVKLGGEIGNNVKLRLDNGKGRPTVLEVSDSAKIGGNLDYLARKEALISKGAQIKGAIQPSFFPEKEAKKFRGINWAFSTLYSIFASLIIGLVLVSLWGEEIRRLTDNMLEQTGKAFGWGLVSLLIVPPLAIILLFTVIGIPLAFLLIVVWLIALCLSRLLVAILIGRSILEKLWPNKSKSMMLAMVFGIIITWLLFSTPFIGWIFGLAAILWGLGGIFMFFKKA